jgi:hypothetical protein
MDKEYSLFLSLNGEIIVKNNESLSIWLVDKFGIAQAFANDKELFEMILFPIDKVPKGKTWKRHRQTIKKLLTEQS